MSTAVPLLSECIRDLQRDEGLRLTVYDDATGNPIVPGYTLIGHPSIGYGRALDTNGITIDEANYLLLNIIDEKIIWAENNLVWFVALSQIRQRVIINMIYNIGTKGFLEFKEFILDIAQGRFTQAATDLLNSKAARQNIKRYRKLAYMVMHDQESELA